MTGGAAGDGSDLREASRHRGLDEAPRQRPRGQREVDRERPGVLVRLLVVLAAVLPEPRRSGADFPVGIPPKRVTGRDEVPGGRALSAPHPFSRRLGTGPPILGSVTGQPSSVTADRHRLEADRRRLECHFHSNRSLGVPRT